MLSIITEITLFEKFKQACNSINGIAVSWFTKNIFTTKLDFKKSYTINN